MCLVAQSSCLTLCHCMDYSPSGSSVHWDSPGVNTGVGCHALLQGILPTQGLNPGLLHCRQILYHLSHQGSPISSYMDTSLMEIGAILMTPFNLLPLYRSYFQIQILGVWVSRCEFWEDTILPITQVSLLWFLSPKVWFPQWIRVSWHSSILKILWWFSIASVFTPGIPWWLR